MTSTVAVSFDDQLAEVEREVEVRKKLYPGWVTEGRIIQSAAQERLARLIAARDTLRAMKQHHGSIPKCFFSLRNVETKV
jgi:hypothetical protein